MICQICQKKVGRNDQICLSPQGSSGPMNTAQVPFDWRGTPPPCWSQRRRQRSGRTTGVPSSKYSLHAWICLRLWGRLVWTDDGHGEVVGHCVQSDTLTAVDRRHFLRWHWTLVRHEEWLPRAQACARFLTENKRSNVSVHVARLRGASHSAVHVRPVATSTYQQTLDGSFSAVSKPNFAGKYAFESPRRDLHNALLCTALQSQILAKNRWILRIPRKFGKKFNYY